MASREQVENQKELNRLKKEQAELDKKSNENLEYVAIAFKNIVDELRAGNNQRKIQEQLEKSRISSLTKSANIAQQLLEVARGEVFLTKKQLDNLEKRNAREKENFKRIRDSVGRRTELGQLIQKEIHNLSQVQESQRQIEKTIQDTNKALGFAPQLAAGFDKALQKAGLPALGIAEAIEETQKDAQVAGKSFDAMGSFASKMASNLKESATATNITQLAVGVIVNKMLEINNLQTDFRRLTGESAENINVLNGALISTSDQLRTMVSLTETFGFNANMAFDAINIQEATELSNLMGLSAEEAGNLAFFAQASGDNLKEAASNIYDGTAAGLSQKKILQDVGNVSNEIAMTFGGNLEKMGATASAAKLLGLNLQQVDNIASGLLDIESSIAAEFQAEVISGKQLNLERARFFALTNDLEGLTREIGKNQEIIDSFATGNRIEQEATAEALGLSRDEMSKMVFNQAIAAGLSTEEAAARSDMGIEDAKRLGIQQSLNKSIEKMAELLAGPLESFATLLENAFVLKGLMIAIGTITTVSFAKSLSSALISIGAMIPKLVIQTGLLSSQAIAAITTASALTLGLGTVAILAAAAFAVAGFSSLMSKSKNVGDAILPASGGPIVSTMEGGIFKGTRNDDVLMGPGLARGGRNQGLSKEDISAIAVAVKDGASRANINLDGGRVSNRIQPPLAMNTRKYSV
jgi:hypothetical protein